VRVQAGQILTVANAEALTTTADAIQQELSAAPDDLRTFLKGQVLTVWATDLRIAVDRSLASGGTNVKAAAQAALDGETVDTYLPFLNDGLYLARARDCAL
jgi:hypothetical protein